MVTGVSEGYARVLEIVGTGYRAEMQGEKLILYLGHSHPIESRRRRASALRCRGGAVGDVLGIDKELVGEIAARIRRQRPPEPYKGKGVRYQGEYVDARPGKRAASASRGRRIHGQGAGKTFGAPTPPCGCESGCVVQRIALVCVCFAA